MGWEQARAHTQGGALYILEPDLKDHWLCTSTLVETRTSIDATEIHPRLWQGGRPPIGPALWEAGFHAVVLCAEQYQPRNEEFPGVEVIRAPFLDTDEGFRSGDLGFVVSAARRAAALVEAGKTVLVTCEFGHNRSGLVLGTALHLVTGWKGDQVVRTIQSTRALALSNSLYVRCLHGDHEPFVDALFPV
jgi:protein-tyrosine phosphatase